jgi:hypothetical protein
MTRYVLVALLITLVGLLGLSRQRPETQEEIYSDVRTEDLNLPDIPCIQMYECIEKYSKKYGIPKNIAYGIANAETGYVGPTQFNYVHGRVSSAGAVGPMQIMYPTAKGLWPKEQFTKEKLRTDIDFNVETSMKYMRRLYDINKNWQVSLGQYNTGRPIVNGYAIKVVNYEI